MRTTNRMAKRGGFTLIELTVVILILVALAGIMVPLLTGYVERSHNSAAAANISEITKQIELYKVKTLKGYPDKWDSLTQGSSLWQSGGYGIPANAAALLKAQQLSASEAQALNDAGITTLYDFTGFVLNAQNATFDTPTNSVSVASGATVAMIDDQASGFTTAGSTLLAETVPNADFATYDYVLFGLGNRCTAVGSVMVEAPVHFDTIDPAVFYQHYGVIFAVPKSSSVGIVKLVSVVGIHDGGLSGLHDHVKEYMKTVNSDK